MEALILDILQAEEAERLEILSKALNGEKQEKGKGKDNKKGKGQHHSHINRAARYIAKTMAVKLSGEASGADAEYDKNEAKDRRSRQTNGAGDAKTAEKALCARGVAM